MGPAYGSNSKIIPYTSQNQEVPDYIGNSALILQYLSDIFSAHGSCDGLVAFRSGPKKNAIESYVSLKSLSENLPFVLSCHNSGDSFFSFSTFNKKKHCINSIVNVFAWSIDVDYKNEAARPLDVYSYIMENVGIPTPNYVEYGHRLRLVYIFKEPLRLFSKQKNSLLRGFNFMQKCFCRMINEELGFEGSFGAEANPACSFFRIPGSTNSKDGSVIKILHTSEEKWTMQELFEEWIPARYLDASSNRDEWYNEWKKNKKKKKKKSKGVYSAASLWEYRKNAFLSLRSTCSHRKRLLFWYAVSLLHTNENLSNMEEALFEFNKGYPQPLSENDLRNTFKWIVKNQKAYKASDAFLAEQLEISTSYFSRNTKKERDLQRYKKKRASLEKCGKTKAQKIRQRQKEVEALANSGTALSKIAELLGVSLATIKRDVREIKRNSVFLKEKNARVFSHAMQNAVMFAKKITETVKPRGLSPDTSLSPSQVTPEGAESLSAFGAAYKTSQCRRWGSIISRLAHTRRAGPQTRAQEHTPLYTLTYRRTKMIPLFV